MAITKVSRGLLNTGVSDSSDATAITINSSEQVGIGTTSPVATLQVKTQADANLAFQNSTSVTGGLKLNCFNDAANASSPFEIDGSTLQFNIGASEKMRIDSSGNVGIGLTNPSGYGKLAVSGTATQLALNASSGKSRIGFFEAGTGRFYIDTLNGSDGLAFLDGNGSSERMRIQPGGGIIVGGTSTGGTVAAQIEANGGDSGRCFQTTVTGTGSANAITFNNGNGQVGRITTSGSATSYVGTSDYRMKENIVYDWNAMTKVKNLKPAQFNFKTNTDEIVEGFIAHEAQSVVPYAVVGEKDGEEMQGMDYGKLTAILTKAIQEQQEIIDDLKARIEVLEA